MTQTGPSTARSALDEVRAAVLAAAKTMYARGLVEGTAGNVSGRVDDGTVVVTPSSLSYEEMTLDDLVVVDLDGKVVRRHPLGHVREGRAPGHPRGLPGGRRRGPLPRLHASMFAVAHRPIPAAIDEFVVYIGGDVPVRRLPAVGQRQALSAEVASHLADRSAVLMANHGLVTIGKSVEDALHSALVVEHNAHIMWGAQQLGGVVALPDKPIRDFTGVYQFVREQTWVTG